MGLDVSHDAFHGAYSAFNRFRQAVCKAAGGSFPPHDDVELLRRLNVENPEQQIGYRFGESPFWYVPDHMTADVCPGLYEFFAHSDCDGEISPEMCAKVAAELEPLLPLVETSYPATGHIERDGGFRAVLQRFIDGCRAAAAAGETLEFH